MKILVAGCGKIGTTILSSLTAEGHDVTALDTDAAVIAEITNIYDVMGVVGNAADCETLTEAGVQQADILIATTVLTFGIAGRVAQALRNREGNSHD